MISLDFSVSGVQLGRALANDAEEFVYALDEIADDDTAYLGQEIAAQAPYGLSEKIVVFLRALADQIEEAAK